MKRRSRIIATLRSALMPSSSQVTIGLIYLLFVHLFRYCAFFSLDLVTFQTLETADLPENSSRTLKSAASLPFLSNASSFSALRRRSDEGEAIELDTIRPLSCFPVVAHNINSQGSSSGAQGTTSTDLDAPPQYGDLNGHNTVSFINFLLFLNQSVLLPSHRPTVIGPLILQSSYQILPLLPDLTLEQVISNLTLPPLSLETTSAFC